MITIRDRDFRIVSSSRNLRGIIDYSRRHIVERVDIWPHASGTAQLGITWTNGASVITDFQSSTVCEQWCASRRRFPAAVIHSKA